MAAAAKAEYKAPASPKALLKRVDHIQHIPKIEAVVGIRIQSGNDTRQSKEF